MSRLDTISKIIPDSLHGLRIGSRNLSSIISSLRHIAAELHIVESALKSPNTLRIVGVCIRHNLRSVSTYERTIAMLRRSIRTIARTRKSLRDMNAYMEDAAPQVVGLVRDALLQLDIREEQLLKHLAKDEADLEEARRELEHYRALYAAVQRARNSSALLFDHEKEQCAELRERLTARADKLRNRSANACRELYNSLAKVADTVTTNRDASNFVTTVLMKAAVMFEYNVTHQP